MWYRRIAAALTVILFVLLCAVNVFAQGGQYSTARSSPEPLPDCSPASQGQLQPFVWDTTSAELKTCVATNEWVAIGTGFSQPNDTTTGTSLNGTAIVNSSGDAIQATTSDTSVPVYIVLAGAGTSGNAILASSGLAPCVMDSTISSGAGGYYVINSTITGGDCHAQSSAPASGTPVIGFLHDSSTTTGSTAVVQIQSFVIGFLGTVIGPSSSTTGDLAGFADTTGQLLEDLSPPSVTVGFAGNLTNCINSITGSIPTIVSSGTPNCEVPGTPFAKITTTPYAVQPDTSGSGGTIVDRATLNELASGSSVVNLCDPSGSGCQQYFPIKFVADGTKTINATGSATISLYTGNTYISSLTTFTVYAGNVVSISLSGDNVTWIVRVEAPPQDATASTGTSYASGCDTSAATVTVDGATTAMVPIFAPTSDVSGVSGWGSTGGLVIDAWVSAANTVSYKVCNQTASTINTTAVTWNVTTR